MSLKKEIIENKDKIHTTELGVKRICRNLNLKNDNAVEFCIDVIQNENSKVSKRGKNYYINHNDIEITLNSSSFTIITAHIKK